MTDDQSTTVLVVEDNPGDVRLIQELLDEGTKEASVSSAPRPVDDVGTLARALEHLEQHAYAAVLLDLGLPDSSGIATLEAVRDHAPTVPIVVLTGLDRAEIGVQSVQQGAQEYLTKDQLTPVLLDRSIRHAIERKKFDRTQTALHEASRDLIQTQSETDVATVTVRTALDVLDVDGIAMFIFDEAENCLEPAAYTDAFEAAFDELPAFGPAETSITWEAFVSGETVVHEQLDESPPAHIYRTDTSFRSGIWIPLGNHGILLIMSEQPTGLDQRIRRLADHLAATAEAALTRVEREVRLKENERQRAEQFEQLQALHRMNELIREIDQLLVRSTTRKEIEQAVTDRLTQEERFPFAWIGGRIGDEFVPRTWNGPHDGYLDAISFADGNDPPPALAAWQSGETVSRHVATDFRDADWREAALGRGLTSVLSLPLVYNELSYGVLTVYANESDVFNAQLAEMFEELAETIGNALNAAETRRALLTNMVVELELQINATDDTLVRLARGADCEIEYQGIVPQSDNRTRLYFRATGSPSDSILDVATTIPSIRDIDLISNVATESDAHRFEATITGPTIPSALLECGGVARSIRIDDAHIRARVELPESTDVRTFVERFEERYAETDLIARRDQERSSGTATEALLTRELTDRQLEALETAYHSGYFEWPRMRTGEEVATSLDITQPTFNAHIRSAERKLCAMLFEDAPDQHM